MAAQSTLEEIKAEAITNDIVQTQLLLHEAASMFDAHACVQACIPGVACSALASGGIKQQEMAVIRLQYEAPA